MICGYSILLHFEINFGWRQSSQNFITGISLKNEAARIRLQVKLQVKINRVICLIDVLLNFDGTNFSKNTEELISNWCSMTKPPSNLNPTNICLNVDSLCTSSRRSERHRHYLDFFFYFISSLVAEEGTVFDWENKRG